MEFYLDLNLASNGINILVVSIMFLCIVSVLFFIFYKFGNTNREALFILILIALFFFTCPISKLTNSGTEIYKSFREEMKLIYNLSDDELPSENIKTAGLMSK